MLQAGLHGACSKELGSEVVCILGIYRAPICVIGETLTDSHTEVSLEGMLRPCDGGGQCWMHSWPSRHVALSFLPFDLYFLRPVLSLLLFD